MAKIQNILIGLFIFLIAMLSFGYAMLSLVNENGVTINAEHSQFFSNLNNSISGTSSIAREMESSLQDSDTPSNEDFSAFTVIGNIPQMFLDSIGIIDGIATDTGRIFGVAGWIMGLLVLMLITAIVWAILEWWRNK